MKSSNPVFWKILELESKSARIEGIFLADPELARLWRGQVALTEACRSVSLEDIHVFEGDVIYRHLENRLTDVEGARGAASVGELLRVIVSPGDVKQDPVLTLQRCWRAAVTLEDEGSSLEVEETASEIRNTVNEASGIFLGSLRAAIVHRFRTESRMPSADRLVFMVAEHSLRGGGQGYDPGEDYPEVLLRRMNASWIFTPSLALTQGRFRAWSPAGEPGHLDLMDGIHADLDRTLGAVPMLRKWREDARSFAAGKHGRSRLRDLVELAMREPILTSGHVRNVLGVSERASLYLMEEAEAAGILSLITPRRSYRVWATPMMAQNLRMRASRSSAPARGPGPVRENAGDASITVTDEQASYEERAEAALSELDKAMEQADAVLAKYRKSKDF